MDRFRPHAISRIGFLALIACVLLPTTGCVGRLLATGVWLIQGNSIDAEYEGLEGKRVVVACRPPSSMQYRNLGADREIVRRVSSLLAANVKGIDVVPPSEVENWEDVQDWGEKDLAKLAEAVKADMVVYVMLEDFRLLKDPTLYQGRADTVVSVLSVEDGDKELWRKSLGEVLYPVNSAVPALDRPIRNFRQQFVEVLSTQIARHFYEHDAQLDFAADSLAHR